MSSRMHVNWQSGHQEDLLDPTICSYRLATTRTLDRCMEWMECMEKCGRAPRCTVVGASSNNDSDRDDAARGQIWLENGIAGRI